MSIREVVKKINTPTVLAFIIIVLVGFASFGLGRLSALESQGESLKYYPAGLITTDDTTVVNKLSGDDKRGPEGRGSEAGLKQQDQALYVGSKNSDKFHYPWCSGAQRIKDSNKVWFSSVEEARAAGYEPAGNCPGL